MRLAIGSIALAIVLGSGPALAENWVKVIDDDDYWLNIDKDSIRRGGDNLVYFQSDEIDKSDNAADCQNRLLYTLKIYVHGGLDYPNWRNDGRAVVAGSAGEAELQYVCANV
jgi:hypothetical protein